MPRSAAAIELIAASVEQDITLYSSGFRAEVRSAEVQKGSLQEKPDPLSHNCPR